MKAAAERGDVPWKIEDDQAAVLGPRMADPDAVLEDMLSRIVGNHMDRALIHRLMPRLRARRLGAGAHLWRRGDAATSCAIVASGKLHAVRAPDPGQLSGFGGRGGGRATASVVEAQTSGEEKENTERVTTDECERLRARCS